MKRMLVLVCVALLAGTVSAGLTHQWTFNDGTTNDYVGGTTGTLEKGASVAGGSLILPGGSPGGRAVLDAAAIGINTYTEGISIETWFTADELGGWTRLFDFGDTSGWDGGYCLFYTPSGPGHSRLAIGTYGFPTWSTGEEQVQGPALVADTEYHVVCVYDPYGGNDGKAAMIIYQDGVEVSSNLEVTMLLTDVHDVHAYLGSAVYPGDPELKCSINEFNIYNTALTAGEVADNYAAGPVPEPTTMALLGLGALLLRKRK